MKYLLYFKEALPVMMYFAFVLVGGSTMANSIQSWQIKSGKCGWWIEKLVVCASLVRCYHTGKILVLVFFFIFMILENASDLQIYQVECKKKKVCFWCVENFCIDLPPPFLCVCGRVLQHPRLHSEEDFSFLFLTESILEPWKKHRIFVWKSF